MVKKKLRQTPKTVKSEQLAVPDLSRPRESEEEEDYAVADLSAIPAPKIEFVMPNLTPMDGSKKKLPEKVKVSEKVPSSSEGSTLTAEQLNIEIVRLRSVVQKAQKFLVQRLVRKMKRIEALLAKKENDVMKRKVKRYEEEIHFLKTIKRDDVSKFALLNKKNLNELRITDKTPVNERCLYKLACEPPVINAVEQYRIRYPSWEVTAAYLLQRLGVQYSSTKELTTGVVPSDSDGGESSEEDGDETPEKLLKSAKVSLTERSGKASKVQNHTSVSQWSRRRPVDDESDEDQTSEDDSEGHSDSSGEDVSNVAVASGSDNDEQEAARRRELLIGPLKSARIVKKMNKKAKAPPLKRTPRALASDLSEGEPPTTGPMHSMRMVKKKNDLLRGKAPRIVASELSEGDTPSMAVVKKVKLSEAGEIKLCKRPPVAGTRRDQENTARSSSPEPDSFFLPVASASTISKNVADLSRNDASLSFQSEGVQPSEKSAKLRTSKRVSERVVGNSRIPKGLVAKKKVSMVKKMKMNLREEPPPKTASLQNPEELHPSWAARRQAKERQLSAPQGKRIVFDED